MAEIKELKTDTIEFKPARSVICGGFSETQNITENDKALFEEFREVIEQKVQAQFGVPKDFKLTPAKVRTQVVAGTNYRFHVGLPNGQFAHVTVFQPLKSHVLEGSDRSSRVTVDPEAKSS